MPTIHLRQNIYQGVNAHLHSIALNPAEDQFSIWPSFHNLLISQINLNLNDSLPEHYVARAEQSLQIWTEEYVLGTPASAGRKTQRPDVTIFRQGAGPATSTVASVAPDDTPTRVVSLDDYYEDKLTIPATIIYDQRSAAGDVLDHPVTRIEVLSRSNKGGGNGYAGYLSNRQIALRANTSLIELDLLHEGQTPIPKMPHYPHEHDSHPYLIAVTDRRQRDVNTDMLVYVLAVDMPLPRQAFIPLHGDESLQFDFDAAYQAAFRGGRFGFNLDYDLPPRKLASYSQADQSRIQAVMQRTQAAAQPTTTQDAHDAK